MKKNLTVLALLLTVALLCCACSAAPQTPAEDSGEKETTTTPVESKKGVAVLTQDITLENCYAINRGQGGTEKEKLPCEAVKMKKGDVVQVVLAQDKSVEGMVPYSPDAVFLYVTLPADKISQDEKDIQAGNQVLLEGDLYDKPEGLAVTSMSGIVVILSREGDWWQVQPYAGGDTATYWVKAENLTYQFGQ